MICGTTTNMETAYLLFAIVSKHAPYLPITTVAQHVFRHPRARFRHSLGSHARHNSVPQQVHLYVGAGIRTFGAPGP